MTVKELRVQSAQLLAMLDILPVEQKVVGNFAFDLLMAQVTKLDADINRLEVNAKYERLTVLCTDKLQTLASSMAEVGVKELTLHVTIDAEGKIIASAKSGTRTTKTEIAGTSDGTKNRTIKGWLVGDSTEIVSGSKACELLGLDRGADSANRVIQRNVKGLEGTFGGMSVVAVLYENTETA